MRIDMALAWFVIGAACALVGCKTTELPTASVYDVLPGTWGSTFNKSISCDSNPHTISFTEDRTEMLLTYAKPRQTRDGEITTVRYKVLSDKPYLHLSREGEKRRNPAGGRLARWDLVMVSSDRYCWHRTDWLNRVCGTHIVRCQSDQDR